MIALRFRSVCRGKEDTETYEEDRNDEHSPGFDSFKHFKLLFDATTSLFHVHRLLRLTSCALVTASFFLSIFK